jgi:hypothetical protein
MTGRRYRRLIKPVKKVRDNENRDTNFMAGGSAIICARAGHGPSSGDKFAAGPGLRIAGQKER